MLAVERQQRIKELILNNRSMKISDLSRELDVSEMTIHRDIKPLIKEGFILKTFGGITLACKHDLIPTEDAKCIICGRNIDDKFAFRMILRGNGTETACCSHCGFLRYDQIEHDVSQAICRDFFVGTTINAQAAWYVWDSEIQIGCCQPQILTFEIKDHAERFVKGFGGAIMTFAKANEKIRKEHQI